MARDTKLIGAAALIAAGLLFARRAAAAPVSDIDPTGEIVGDVEWWPADQETEDQTMSNSPARNLGAFLYMLQVAETGQAAFDSGLSYQTFYGGAIFNDLSDHPVITGEMRGVRLSDAMCRAAGYGPGCVSTAAGAYQFIRPTWERLRKAGSWGPRLPDFSIASQDEAARRQLIELGALHYVEAGEFDNALRLASKVWASLPGSTANQSPKSYAVVQGYYLDALRVA